MDTSSPSANLRSSRQRPSKMAPPLSSATPEGAPLAPRLSHRNSPYLPTPIELLLLASYPALLVFGSIFAALSPQTRGQPYDYAAHAHQQHPSLAPSYFARKDNLFNTLFVKRGWAWISISFFIFLWTHPAATASTAKRARAAVRWAVVTAWWFFVTQWAFGPPLIDRGFLWTGGRCEAVEARVEAAEETPGGRPGTKDVFTAAACKSAGGEWSGGHDISGHVFLLVLGSFFLVQEVGWVALRWSGRRQEERSIVMTDGSIRGAGVEAEDSAGNRQGASSGTLGLGLSGKLAAAIVALSWWMVLMTAIYFHTWVEKLTGLLVATSHLYVVYVLPRWIPALRAVFGLPGI